MQKKLEHAPTSDPERRAIYGFFLLILSIIFLILFILLSYLPIEWLNQIGLTYLPQKYWYLAIPSYIVILPFLTLAIYTTLNMRMVNNLNSLNSIKDEYSIYYDNNFNKNSLSLPPVADIPLTKICEILYLDKKN
jgi:phosphatidylinositol glycan class P protein